MISVTDCLIQQGIVWFLWIIIDFTKDSVNYYRFCEGNIKFSLRIWRELGSQKKPNRIPVLRDQKVLPEVRNRSLLVRDLVSYSNSEMLLQSNRWTYSFIPSISDIPISLSCSLRSSSNRRLVISELHFDTRFKIYSSTIGVRNLVCYVPLGQ